jgi:hypothetical protein
MRPCVRRTAEAKAIHAEINTRYFTALEAVGANAFYAARVIVGSTINAAAQIAAAQIGGVGLPQPGVVIQQGAYGAGRAPTTVVINSPAGGGGGGHGGDEAAALGAN